jgi:pimeloyl-ACP methyl ester carboxylesterase
VSDRTVSYEDYGSGPIVLLVHGSPGNGKAWSRVGERLSKRYRVIAPDLPGYGETTALPLHAEPDTADTAALLEALMTTIGSPAVVAGHSYGGVVALTLALRGRLRMGALALFEPVAVPILLMTGQTELFHATKAIFDDYIARVDTGEADAIKIMVDFWFGPGAFARMPEPLTTVMTRARETNTRDIRSAFRSRYTPEALGGLTMPLVTVVGGRSPEITGRIARAIVGHTPRGSLVTLDTATHALTRTHAEAVAQAIDEIAGQGTGAAIG